MKPRARDIIGALVLSAILLALVVWVVVLASQGS
jgi:diacylglycerol kinase